MDMTQTELVAVVIAVMVVDLVKYLFNSYVWPNIKRMFTNG